jgi:levanase/fructan beta-fructosidase
LCGKNIGARRVAVNGLRVPAPLRGGEQRLAICCDSTALEVFASDGLTYVPTPLTPNTDDLALGTQAKGGQVSFSMLEAHELGSAWE